MALLAQVSDVVCVVDAEGTVVEAVPGGLTRVLGWSVDELVERNVFDLVHRQDHDRAAEGFMQVIGPDDVKPVISAFAIGRASGATSR